MITPLLKDSLLRILTEGSQPEKLAQIDRASILTLLSDLNIEFSELDALLTYFQRIGFIDDLNCRQISIFLIVRVEAIDFMNRGGFTLNEAVFERNMEQLLLEIDLLKKNLNPDQLDQADKIFSIASVLLGAITTFTSFKSR